MEGYSCHPDSRQVFHLTCCSIFVISCSAFLSLLGNGNRHFGFTAYLDAHMDMCALLDIWVTKVERGKHLLPLWDRNTDP